MLKAFRWPLIITAAVLAAAGVLWGGAGLGTVAMLTAMGVSFSVDNAVVTAQILQRLAPVWRRIFLTGGLFVAVFGMLLGFPLLVVCLAGHMGPLAALRLAVTDSGAYGVLLTAAQTSIDAFGGVFLLMVFLTWAFTPRDVRWLRWLERPLAAIGRYSSAATIVTLLVLLGLSRVADPAHRMSVLVAGVAGLSTHLAVDGLDKFFGTEEGASLPGTVAKGGLATFLYLEVVDASFSFDGVVGAFAVTNKLLWILTGLAVSALFVRTLTVQMVERGTLDSLVHLEHGAHWAVGMLAVIMLASVRVEVPDVLTGCIGLAFIGASLLTSWRALHRRRAPLAA